MGLIPQSVVEDVQGMKPKSFGQVMAAVMTLVLFGFAAIVYLREGSLPEWLAGAVGAALGVWWERPGK